MILRLHFLPPLALLLLLLSGCEKGNETLRGLQEENRILREQVGDLKAPLAAVNRESRQRVEDVRRLHEEQSAEAAAIERNKIAQLEGQVAALRLELGSVQREKVALAGLVDSRPR